MGGALDGRTGAAGRVGGVRLVPADGARRERLVDRAASRAGVRRAADVGGVAPAASRSDPQARLARGDRRAPIRGGGRDPVDDAARDPGRRRAAEVALSLALAPAVEFGHVTEPAPARRRRPLPINEIPRARARGDLDEALLLLARYYGEAELASRALEQLLETEPHRRQ